MSDPVDGAPAWLLERHPELVAVHAALAQHGRGEPITAVCPSCGTPIEVTEVEATGTLVVACQTGDTHVRFRRRPQAARRMP